MTTVDKVLAKAKRLAGLPWFPLDYAGQGRLRRHDNAGDDAETFITVPNYADFGGGVFEGDRVAQSIADATVLLPKMVELVEVLYGWATTDLERAQPKYGDYARSLLVSQSLVRQMIEYALRSEEALGE